MRYAFEVARSRPRKKLTVVTKSNAQRHGMVFWDEIAALVSHDYPDVTWDKELVDAMTMRMVKRPRSIDTVVATNLHADILSDLAAALAGSFGIAPTGNIDPERRGPSMFEPIHGSAFDITGKGVANPVASFWTAAMMLEHLGEKPAADLLMRAVEQVCAAGIMTPDIGGTATTKEVTRAVCDAVRGDERGRGLRQALASRLAIRCSYLGYLYFVNCTVYLHVPTPCPKSWPTGPCAVASAMNVVGCVMWEPGMTSTKLLHL